MSAESPFSSSKYFPSTLGAYPMVGFTAPTPLRLLLGLLREALRRLVPLPMKLLVAKAVSIVRGAGRIAAWPVAAALLMLVVASAEPFNFGQSLPAGTKIAIVLIAMGAALVLGGYAVADLRKK